MTSGPLWMLGIILAPITLDVTFLGRVCRVSGFFQTSLVTVFLNTIIVISVSRFIFLLSPTIYTTIFPNNVTNRILLFAVWMYSIALSAPPLNPGIWGEYYRFDTICIPKWSSSADLSYPLFHTAFTLVPAVFYTSAALVMIALKRNCVEPASNPQLNRIHQIRRVNVEVLYISLACLALYISLACLALYISLACLALYISLACLALYISLACLALYISLWLPLVLISNSNISDDPITSKLNFDRQHASNIISLYFMYARGILHPIIYLCVSGEMRRAAVSVFCCTKFEVGTQRTTVQIA